MRRKQRPGLFYDTTTRVCSTCLHPAEARILRKDGRGAMDRFATGLLIDQQRRTA